MAIRKLIKQLGAGEIRALDKWEVLDRINKLKTARDRALVAFLYLTACRIEEVVKYIQEKNLNHKRFNRKTNAYDPDPIVVRKVAGMPIVKKQIEVFPDRIVVQTVRTLKRRKQVFRSIPIMRNDLEREFVEVFLDYVRTLKDDDFLFPFTRQRAYQILSGVGIFPHYQRHTRNTILVTKYGFSGTMLQTFNGWGTSASGDSYVHLNVQDLIDKMQKEVK